MHTIYIVAVVVIVPVLFFFVECLKKPGHNKLSVFCKWFVFWSLGVRGLTAGLMQTINPYYTANLLQIITNDFIVIRELGFANLTLGVLGVCSLFFPEYRKSAALASGVFLTGAGALHISRLAVIDFNELMSLAGDLFQVAVCVITFVTESRANKQN